MKSEAAAGAQLGDLPPSWLVELERQYRFHHSPTRRPQDQNVLLFYSLFQCYYFH
jgi:hypothetical protein